MFADAEHTRARSRLHLRVRTHREPLPESHVEDFLVFPPVDPPPSYYGLRCVCARAKCAHCLRHLLEWLTMRKIVHPLPSVYICGKLCVRCAAARHLTMVLPIRQQVTL